MELLQGTFNQHAHEEDVMALLKRANVVIFGRKAVYFRPANPNAVAVKVFHYPEEKDQNLLSDDVTDRMAAYKKGRKVQAPIEDAAWALAFTTRCFNQKKVTGFKYDVAWGNADSLRPVIKEVKPSVAELSEGISEIPSTEAVGSGVVSSEHDAAGMPAYVPGVASGSGGDDRNHEEAANAKHVDSSTNINQDLGQVKNEPVGGDAMSPSKKRRTTTWSLNTSNVPMVIDLEDNLEVDEPEATNATDAAVVPMQGGGSAIDHSTQTSLVRGLEALMAEDATPAAEPEDPDSDVLVSPLQIPDASQDSD